MSILIIITLCVILLIAYVFDLSSSKTRIPSVVLLLFLGWLLRQLSGYLSLHIPDLSGALPVLGTVGLILIVLEGSLELELNRSKAPLIRKSFFTALVPMLLMAFGLAYVLQFFGEPDFKKNLVNSIPLCVISSAIAIPSVRALSAYNKEFIIYESSLSDIIGVLFFNMIALNSSFGLPTFGHFFLELLVITAVSFVCTIGLALLLNRIEHHVKFVPIILLIILIYCVSKEYHLPGLIFILIFGLFLGNLDELKSFPWIKRFHPDELDKEVHKFRDLTGEGAFLIRALFFLLFGYLIETSELMNTDSLVWAIGITAAIFLLRGIQLLISRLPLSPLLFVAPRGLITILLFLAVDSTQTISLINRSLIIQVILLTALVMMFGLMFKRKPLDEALNHVDTSVV
ncbi:MAG: cation:proton antiporter [Bacteroidota bacterium]